MTIARQIAAAALTGMLAMGTSAALADDDDALPAAQVIAAIEAAVAAHPGKVQEVDVEKKDNRDIVKVEITADDGSERTVHVDGQTGEVKK